MAAASWAKGRLDIVVTTGSQDCDGLWHRVYDDSGPSKKGWAAWTKISLKPRALALLSPPLSMCSWGPGRLDLLTGGRHMYFEKSWDFP